MIVWLIWSLHTSFVLQRKLLNIQILTKQILEKSLLYYAHNNNMGKIVTPKVVSHVTLTTKKRKLWGWSCLNRIGKKTYGKNSQNIKSKLEVFPHHMFIIIDLLEQYKQHSLLTLILNECDRLQKSQIVLNESNTPNPNHGTFIRVFNSCLIDCFIHIHSCNYTVSLENEGYFANGLLGCS